MSPMPTQKVRRRPAHMALWIVLLGMAAVAAAPPSARAADAEAPLAPPGQDALPPAITAGALAAEEETPSEEQRFEEMMRAMQEQRRQGLERIQNAPEWRPSHRHAAVIRVAADEKPTRLNSFCLDREGNVLAACGGASYEYAVTPRGSYEQKRIEMGSEIRVFRPDGTPAGVWPLEFSPQAIALEADGNLLVAGDGRLARLAPDGTVLQVVDTPPVAAQRQRDEAAARRAEQAAAEEGEPAEDAAAQEPPRGSVFDALGRALLGLPSRAEREAQQAALAEMSAGRTREVISLAVSAGDVFLVCPMEEGFGYALWRLDRDLTNPVQIVDKLRGCCGQMDVKAKDGIVYIAENTRHRVACYDRDGKFLRSIGKRSRGEAAGFGSCCNPMNVCFSPEGELLTSESGPPDAVKRFSLDGDFRGVVALPEMEGGCVRVAVDISADGRQVFVMNTGGQEIHVFADARFEPTHRQASVIKIGEGEGDDALLNTFCLDGDGNLLAACGGSQQRYVRGADGSVTIEDLSKPSELRVLDPAGKLLRTIPLPFKPEAVNVDAAGAIFVAGEGEVMQLAPAGEVVLRGKTPNAAKMEAILAASRNQLEANRQRYEQQQQALRQRLEDLAAQLAALPEGAGAAERGSLQTQIDAARQQLTLMEGYAERMAGQAEAMARQKLRVSGIAATERDVFIACPAIEGYGFSVWRMDRKLQDPVEIVQGLRGCCGQMDIQTDGNDLLVAENARFRVVRYDREGKELSAFGRRERGGDEGFGSCCNPMNVRIGPDGEIYAAESTVGRIKRFSPEGTFRGVVAAVDVVPGCKHVAIDVSADGRRVYLLDITRSHVVVLEPVEADSSQASIVEGK